MRLTGTLLLLLCLRAPSMQCSAQQPVQPALAGSRMQCRLRANSPGCPSRHLSQQTWPLPVPSAAAPLPDQAIGFSVRPAECTQAPGAPSQGHKRPGLAAEGCGQRVSHQCELLKPWACGVASLVIAAAVTRLLWLVSPAFGGGPACRCSVISSWALVDTALAGQAENTFTLHTPQHCQANNMLTACA